jgi:hypothetical protein
MVKEFYLISQCSKKELHICSGEFFSSHSFSSSLMPSSSSDGDDGGGGKSGTSAEDN